MARHLVATGQLIDEDPAEALAHALAARRLASRIAAVREAVGLAAYHNGEWQTAIAELRTYHRMTGLQSHLAVIADCERALGRPERAIDLFRGAEQEKLDPAVAIELLIVAAGARGDLGQRDAAVAMLQVRELTTETAEPWTARLRYAFADALLAVGRRAEAREWFSRAAEVDTDSETDAAERLLELDGVVIEGDDEDEVAEELAADPDAPGALPARPDADASGAAIDDRTEEDDLAEDDLGEDDSAEDDLGEDDLAEDDLPEDNLGEDDLTEDDLAEDDLAEDDLAEDDLAEDDVAEGERTGADSVEDGPAGGPAVELEAEPEVAPTDGGDRSEGERPQESQAQPR
ncbi:Replicase polyprotein 1ab [Micromonospora craterilacus]|uniref:Replicase polyprotein 1ab n=1 Tax=Micromonospora craterilacus TaxID=1655439 RepID=UPI001F283A24|nr:Replicase polyprotein 1ab [Micromonospora craterilacus]